MRGYQGNETIGALTGTCAAATLPPMQTARWRFASLALALVLLGTGACAAPRPTDSGLTSAASGSPDGSGLQTPGGSSGRSSPTPSSASSSLPPASSSLPSAPAPGTTPGSNPTAAPTPVGSVPVPKASSAPTPAPSAPPTPQPTAVPTAAPAASCSAFPSTNVWNRSVSSLPVRSDSATLVASIGLNAVLHPDFSATGYGIPVNVVSPSTPLSPVAFQYADESDDGPYPIPAAPAVEGGSDRHLILWDRTGCRLYELYAASRSGSSWHAGSGAIWDLRSNQLRPDGWTSADAAGLPILPGLVRYDEVAAGAIRHAIRFTAPQTRSAHIYPARHDAGAGNATSLPPMGLRVRLKASVDISQFGPQARVVLAALKTYGMILADNGSPWYITGAPDPRWNDDQLHALQQLTGADFEVVDTSGLTNG